MTEQEYGQYIARRMDGLKDELAKDLPKIRVKARLDKTDFSTVIVFTCNNRRVEYHLEMIDRMKNWVKSDYPLLALVKDSLIVDYMKDG